MAQASDSFLDLLAVTITLFAVRIAIKPAATSPDYFLNLCYILFSVH